MLTITSNAIGLFRVVNLTIALLPSVVVIVMCGLLQFVMSPMMGVTSLDDGRSVKYPTCDDRYIN